MIRDCPRCLGPMDYELGPKDEPDCHGGPVIEEIWRCHACPYSVAVHRPPWSETEIVERVRAVRAIESVADLDARDRVLAEHGYEWGSRSR